MTLQYLQKKQIFADTIRNAKGSNSKKLVIVEKKWSVRIVPKNSTFKDGTETGKRKWYILIFRYCFLFPLKTFGAK